MIGFTRDAMMFADLDRYFQSAWKESWGSTDSKSVELLSKKYSESKVLALFKANHILIIDEPEPMDAPNYGVEYEPDDRL